ncbi:MAG: hypothetical protein A2W97_04490 [Bacteroidetes bacterium GWE2_40_63]|nr:MAG: hypothetical protein A2W84_06065 [Bacteroidetes bacterium GWC2_40_13]OFX71344.1 MAG: hypothetical protein A2W96_14365 [Bacteroidetes bacterium GWD2_40_43]OFX91461.1 MAG: hypothetical protein A2W97_04490 [Bacteroidetes bacterium GWE2_40_63]OFY19531.1 MAG: hypothetical protein A2W88_02370 [Bacteroidetes bacterium GWF2_40_13]HBX86261.1 hypothetical protein [Marinilabiliales bacterium]
MLKETQELVSTSKSSMYYFQIPTEITRMEPVFLFRFSIAQESDEKNDILLNVALNPKLMDPVMQNQTNKIYEFDNDGICRFNHDSFQNYFIEGEIKLINHEHTSDQMTKRSCFVSITYGNSDEALHFIKGKFDLTHLGMPKIEELTKEYSKQ